MKKHKTDSKKDKKKSSLKRNPLNSNQQNDRKSKIYEMLPHTADVKFRVYGNSLEDLLCNVALTYWDYVCDECGDFTFKKDLNFEYDELDMLVFDLLSELIFLFDTYGYVGKKIQCVLKEKSAEFDIVFSKCNKYKHDVKAITLNDLKIEKNQNKYICEFVLDV